MRYSGCDKMVEGKTYRQVANIAIKALSKLCGTDCGTVSNPYELASVIINNGKTLIKSILDGDEVYYADGWFVVESDGFHFYCDLTTSAIEDLEANGDKFSFKSDFDY